MNFAGFSPDGLTFLADIGANNTKSWFEANRQRYENGLMAPMRALVTDLSGAMLAIDPLLEIRPAVGKTLSRIYRDTRFSADKSPYKSAVWLSFKRPGKDWMNAPAFFLELTAAGHRYGMGYYSAAPATMFALRERIDADPDGFSRLAAEVLSTFDLEGDCYKRRLSSTHPADIQTWYQRRNVYIVRNRRQNEALLSPSFVSELEQAFTAAAGLYRLLWSLKDAA